MEDRAVEALAAVVPPLLGALDSLEVLTRHLNPPDLPALLDAIEGHDAGLRAGRPKLADMPEELGNLRALLEAAADSTLTAFDDLRAARQEPEATWAVYRALRHAPRAQEALYPLAQFLPPVNRFFIAPSLRGDQALEQRFLNRDMRDDVGLSHVDNEPGSRGGFSLYVPETYTPDAAHPIVFALHGGSGSGRSFLWSWLREARTFGAILVAPTAVGETWALNGHDADTPNLMRMLSLVGSHWNVDRSRVLLSGMSDGGTFSYVSGLESGSPFTHLAPTSAAFHPMLAAGADADRIRGLPIFLTHGALDWMFNIDMAREADRALTAAGAMVTYREVSDLSHTFPREINEEILTWLRG